MLYTARNTLLAKKKKKKNCDVHAGIYLSNKTECKTGIENLTGGHLNLS